MKTPSARLKSLFIPLTLCVTLACADEETSQTSNTPQNQNTATNNNSTTTNNGVNGTPEQKANVGRCQDMCDKQKFFDCYDAAKHATCYDSCTKATKAQVDTFIGCVGSSICDAECSLNIDPMSTPVDSGNPVVPTASTCQTSCQAMVNDMCIPNECDAICASGEYAFLVVYCNKNRTGCDFPERCTSEIEENITPNNPDPEKKATEDCQDACGKMQSLKCLDSETATACRALCGSVPKETKESFTQCDKAALGCDRGCYKTLDPQFNAADIPGCKAVCDRLDMFDCFTETSDKPACITQCDTATEASINNFKTCGGSGLCEDDACWVAFKAAN